MKTRKFHPFAALAALAATTAVASAATGSLNTSFGSGGKATANYGGTDAATAVALMSNGKYVVAGTSTALGTSDIAVLRYNSNGTLDTSFSSDGGVLLDIGAGTQDFATSVAVQPDGKILVAGYTNLGGTNDFLLLRFNADGTPDTFFGANGRAPLANFSGDDRANAIVLMSDGRILLGGSWDGGSSDFALARYNKDGTFDTTFSGDGRVSHNVGDAEFAQALAVQSDGKIVAVGYSDDAGTNDFAIVRFNDNGSLDSPFGGGDAEVLVDFGDNDQASSVKILSNGKILVAGTNSVAANPDFAVARLNSDGSQDLTFGNGDGEVDETFGAIDLCRSMVVQPDGRILLAGTSSISGSNDFAVMALKADGALDTGFAGDGTQLTDFSSASADVGNAMVLQPDGRITVVGSTGTDFAAARFNVNLRTDVRVGSDNKANSGNNVYNTTGSGQTLNVSVTKGGGKKNSFVLIQNDGHDTETFTVQGSGNTSNFNVRYLKGNINVTPNVVSGSLSTGPLAPGASLLLKVEITAKTKQANKTATFSITGKASSDATNTDTILIKAKSK